MIAVENLTKSFKRRGKLFRAVDGISFGCAEGEALGIIGPNGAGKSTLFNMLATLLLPDAGRAAIAGHDIATEPEAVRQNIGFVSRDHRLYERMTPRENLRYFGLLNGIDKRDIDAVVDNLLTSLTLGDYMDVPVKSLSFGIGRRVSIGRGIIHRPPVLILDEPLVGLNVAEADVILNFIRDYHRQGQTIVFCSNVFEDVEIVCDRILIMIGGKIAVIGTLAELQAMTGAEYIKDIYTNIFLNVKDCAGVRS